MPVDHVARIRSALVNTSPPRLAAGDALLSLEALVVQAAFWERRYKELRERWNAAVLNPDAMRRDRDLYLAKTVALRERERLLVKVIRWKLPKEADAILAAVEVRAAVVKE